MPSPHPSANPWRNRRLSHAAQDGMMLVLRCGLCRRSVRYWAADLVKVVGPDHEAHVTPFPCGRCRTADYIDLHWRLPSAEELQGLTVRRPVRQIVRWVWKDERA